MVFYRTAVFFAEAVKEYPAGGHPPPPPAALRAIKRLAITHKSDLRIENT